MRTKWLMFNPSEGKAKIITTDFGSKYFVKVCADGYTCLNEVIGWDTGLRPIQVSKEKLIECSGKVLIERIERLRNGKK